MIEKKEDGLLLITGMANIHCGIWVRAKARPRGYLTCRLTNRVILTGELIYRPMTNGFLRGQRILAEEAEKRIDR